MTTSKNNPNDIFWLARYAYNQLGPLFAQAKAIEPTLSFHIEINLADEASKFGSENYVSINAHWGRGGMFQNSSWLRNKGDADRFISHVAADVANLETLVTA